MEDQLIWYYLDPKAEDEQKKTIGPISERDIDVLLRTNALNSAVQFCKEGMNEWKPLYNIPELKKYLHEISSALFLLQTQPHDMPTADAQDSDSQEKIDESQHHEEEHGDESHEHDEANKQLNDDEKMEIIKKKIERNRKKAQKQKEKKKQQWYDSRINSSIYITGLPKEITEEQMAEFFGKAGIIRIEPQNLKPRIKIYRDSQGFCKGDGLVSYKMIESVGIAKDILQDKEITPGFRINLQQAQFQQKGEYKKREKKELDKLQKALLKQKEMAIVGWDGDQGDEGLKIVILKNMYTREQAADPDYMKELYQDVLEECEQSVGDVHKLEIYENHPDGIIKVKFKSAYDADQCISIMNDRFFDGRKIQCFYWDGKIDYKKEGNKESLEDQQQRLEEFSNWIEDDEKHPNKQE